MSRTDILELVDESTRFKCLRCEGCCVYEVTLTPREEKVLSVEASRLGKRLGHMNLNGRSVATTLSSGKGGTPCLFYSDNGCLVYEKRPLLCRLYPFFPIDANEILAAGYQLTPYMIVVGSRTGRAYCLAYDPSCRGIGVGELLDASGIITLYEKYLDEDNSGGSS